MPKLPTFDGRLLAATREAQKKTQGEVGTVAGVSGAAVSAWEVGRTQPTATQLARVCAFLGIAVEDVCSMQAEKARAE